MLDSLTIFEVTDSKICAYLNAKKLLFQNTLRESTCSRVPNTTEICTGAPLSEFSIIPRQIELENISLNNIQNVRTVCENIDGRSHVFS